MNVTSVISFWWLTLTVHVRCDQLHVAGRYKQSIPHTITENYFYWKLLLLEQIQKICLSYLVRAIKTVKAPAAEPGSIPGTHVVEGEVIL